MIVKKISIKNFLGWETLEVTPGKWTVFSGKNGSGKTSVLAALQSVVSGGSAAKLLRKGEKNGEVILVLDDDTALRETITADKTDRSFIHPEFGALPKPQKLIDGLVDVLSVNPVALFTAKPADRLKAVLEAIPLTVTAEQLDGIWPGSSRVVDTKKHALQVIADLHESLYTKRRDVNRDHKDKATTAEQLAAALPKTPEKPWTDEIQRLEAEMDELQTTTAAQMTDAEGEKKLALQAATADFLQLKIGIDAWKQAEIARINAEHAERITATTTAKQRATEAATASEKEKLESIQAAYTPRYEALNQSLSDAKAHHDEHTRAESSRALVARLDGEARALAGQSDKLTGALGKLDALKTSLTADLPIKGLEVVDGEILLDGIPFETLNLAKRVKLVFDIATIRAGKLGFIFVDNAEALDSESFAEFEQAALASGLQVFVSRISDSAFRVETEAGNA